MPTGTSGGQTTRALPPANTKACVPLTCTLLAHPHRWYVYTALKKWSSPVAREVSTRVVSASGRYEGDQEREWPFTKPKACTFQPNNSKHGGYVWCTGEITGEPPLVDPIKHYDEGGNEMEGSSLPPWVGTMRTVQENVSEEFKRTSIFSEEQKADWDRFFNRGVPWGGLKSVPAGRLPVFAVDTSGAAGNPERGVGDYGAAVIANVVGRDGSGRVRMYYKDGKDVAEYETAIMTANFSGMTADGTSTITRKQQESKSAGW